MLDVAIGMNSSSMYDGSHKVIGGNATDQALMRFWVKIIIDLSVVIQLILQVFRKALIQLISLAKLKLQI